MDVESHKRNHKPTMKITESGEIKGPHQGYYIPKNVDKVVGNPSDQLIIHLNLYIGLDGNEIYVGDAMIILMLRNEVLKSLKSNIEIRVI